MTSRTRRLTITPPLTLALVGLFLVGSVVVNRVARRILLPAELAFVPSENAFVVVTGDFESLWSRIEEHFGPAIRDSYRKGPMYEGVKAVRDDLEQRKVPITKVADLAKYGFDIHRGVVVSVSGLTLGTEGVQARAAQILLVLPASNVADVRTFFSTWMAAEPQPLRDAEDLAPFNVVQIDELYLAAVETDLVVVSTSKDMLRRSLLLQATNRQAFLEDDALYDGVSQLLGRPLLNGPTALAFWRPPGTPVRHITLAADLRTEDMAITADIGLMAGALRVIDQFRRPMAASGEWASSLPQNTLAAAAMQEATLTGYLDLAAAIPALRASMESWLHGFLLDLRTAQNLSRVVIAVTGYRDGVPDVLIGVWADPVDMSAKVDGLRARARRERDLALLRAASQNAPDAATADALIQAGELRPEPGAMWAAYQRAGDRWRPPADAAYAFDSERDTIAHDGAPIRYITPALGENDKRLRDTFKDADLDLLRTDRYRLAAMTTDNTTWLSTDSGTLRRIVDTRAGRAPPLPRNALFGATRDTWAGSDKLQLFINVEELAASTALEPDQELDAMRKFLLDFQQQPSIAGAARPGRLRDAVHVVWTMTRVRRTE